MKRTVEVEIPDGELCTSELGYYCRFAIEGYCTLYDQYIDYITIYKKDGFNFLHSHNGWSTKKCKQCLKGE